MTLKSTGTPYAGQFGPEVILGQTGTPFTNGAVTVYESDGVTLATLYGLNATTHLPDKTVSAPNPVTTDNFGNLTFYAARGVYVASFTVGGVSTTDTVMVGPWYQDVGWNVVVDTTVGGGSTFTPLSGDSRLCNAAAGNATYPLTSSALGARFKFARTDSSANTLTITAAAGDLIYGPGLSTGQASITLNSPGANVELHGDGNHGWHVVAGNADSGWLTIASRGYINSWASNNGPAAGGTVAGYRKIGNTVLLGGSVTGGTSGNAITVMLTGWIPTSSFTAPLPMVGGTASTGTLNIGTNGAVTPTFTSGLIAVLDGITWTVD